MYLRIAKIDDLHQDTERGNGNLILSVEEQVDKMIFLG